MTENEFTVALAHAVPGAELVGNLVTAVQDGGGDHPEATSTAHAAAPAQLAQTDEIKEQLAQQLQDGQAQILGGLQHSQANWDAALGHMPNHDMSGYFGDQTVGAGLSHPPAPLTRGDDGYFGEE